jgi:hypothetical protein
LAYASGCGDNSDKPIKTSSTHDAGLRDARTAYEIDAAEADTCSGAPGQLGGVCNKGKCESGLKCLPASTPTLPVRDRESGRELTVHFSSLTANGLCSKGCTVGSDDCGPCGKCTATSFVGRYLVPMADDPKQGVCTLRCTPSLDNRGGCHEGYTCAPGEVCLNACTSDQQCKVVAEDSNGDNAVELTLDSASETYCNLETGLCDHPGGAVGDSCKLSTDCKAYSQCMTNDTIGDGICVREYCSGDQALGCAVSQVCNVRMADLMDLEEEQLGSMCLPGCKVGQETKSLRIGLESHGEGCPIGFACLWDGVSKSDDPINGGCFATPSHNSIAASNLGASCKNDNECYSPWGLGVCRFSKINRGKPGMCVVGECSNYPGGSPFDGILPGVASELPICPAGQGSCVIESEAGKAPATTCFRSCASASDCATGLACASPFENGPRICWHNCSKNDECRQGSACIRDADAVACTGAKGEPCSCR